MTPRSSRLAQLLRPALVDKVERDHRQPDSAFRRRRIVVAVVLVVGATLLGISLSVPAGQPGLLPADAGAGRVWLVGGFASGPLHLGRIAVPRHAAPAGPHARSCSGWSPWRCSSLGALVVREIAPLRDYTEHVLAHARYGSLPLRGC